MKKERLLKMFFMVVFIFLFFFLSSVEVFPGEKEAVSGKQYESFFEQMKKKGFSPAELIKIFSDERLFPDKSVIFSRGKRVSYFSDEFGLFKPESIARGKKVLTEKAAWLEEAEKKYGTEKQVLISLFRLETNFGSYLGERRVLNSLHTLFMFNWRGWAERELMNFLVLCKKNNYDPWSIIGSSAGAFGLWQFMPSSFLDFATDGNGDGQINLFHFEDALLSAAKYLKGKGWRNSQTLHEVISNRHVLWKYNRDVDYGRAVVAYAKVISKP